MADLALLWNNSINNNNKVKGVCKMLLKKKDLEKQSLKICFQSSKWRLKIKAPTIKRLFLTQC